MPCCQPVTSQTPPKTSFGHNNGSGHDFMLCCIHRLLLSFRAHSVADRSAFHISFRCPPSERKQLKIRANRFRCFLKERLIRKEDEDGGYASREPQRFIRQTSVRCLYYSHARRQPANHAGLG